MDSQKNMERPMSKIESLFNELKAAAGTRRNHQEELTEQLELLRRSQAKHTKAKEHLNKAIEDVTLLDKKIVMSKTSNNQIDVKKKNLESVIENTLRSTEQKKRKVDEIQAEFKTNKKLFLKAEEKMVEYQEKVEREFQKGDAYKRALKEEEEIDNMKKQRDEILSEFGIGLNSNDDLNHYIKETTLKIEQLKKENNIINEEFEALQNELLRMKKAKTDLEQEIKVIEKHNTARLLRLKCQLKKAQEVLKSKMQFK